MCLCLLVDLLCSINCFVGVFWLQRPTFDRSLEALGIGICSIKHIGERSSRGMNDAPMLCRMDQRMDCVRLRQRQRQSPAALNDSNENKAKQRREAQNESLPR